MINKIKYLFMSTNNKLMFDTYIKYFSKNDIKIKLERGGKIKVFYQDGPVLYNNWEDLNRVYKQLPVDENQETPIEDIKSVDPIVPVTEYVNKYKWFVYGSKTRSKELLNKFCELNDIPVLNGYDMNKPNWVYYLDSHKNFCSTNNEMIIDLLKSSSDWKEYTLPDPIKLTKQQIAKMINMDPEAFIII